MSKWLTPNPNAYLLTALIQQSTSYTIHWDTLPLSNPYVLYGFPEAGAPLLGLIRINRAAESHKSVLLSIGHSA